MILDEITELLEKASKINQKKWDEIGRAHV